MKKVFLILSVFSLLHSRAFTQTYFPFVENHKTWSEASICPQYTFPYSSIIWTTTYRLEGDTVLNGKVYNTFNVCSDDPSIGVFQEYDMGFREESGKVYQIHYTPGAGEIQLYNFNMALGDSVLIDSTYTYWYAYVTHIDSLEVNGSFRKQIHFDDDWDTWVEGLGSLYRPFEPITFRLTLGNSFELLCVSDSTGPVYTNPNYSQCYLDTIVTATPDPKDARVQISPNPAQSYCKVLLPGSFRTCDHFVLVDMNGVIRREGIIEGNSFTLYRETLGAGMYFLLINGRAGQITGKLIFQ